MQRLQIMELAQLIFVFSFSGLGRLFIMIKIICLFFQECFKMLFWAHNKLSNQRTKTWINFRQKLINVVYVGDSDG